MKTKISLLVISVVVLVAMGVVMSGCSCSKDKEKAKDVPTAKVVESGNGVQYVNDNFPTISPTEKVTNKKGDTIISYTNSDGSKVTRTIHKNGTIRVVIKDKKGKVIKDKTFKSKKTKTTKNDKKKDKSSKKKDKKDDNDGWSDFY